MNIFIRYAMQTDFLPNNFITKAVDDRILFIISGKGKLILPGTVEEICENTLCYYPAGTAYFPQSSKEYPLSFITINFDFSREYENLKNVYLPINENVFDSSKILYPNLNSREGIFKKPFVIHDASCYTEMFLKVADSFKSDNVFGEKIASSILQTICYKILSSQTLINNELCQKIINYINSHYNTLTDNRSVAKALSYHEYYLNRTLKKYTKKTIHEYIIEVRLKNAANLLIYSQKPISQIAFEVGFENANHFSNRFKKHFGISAKDFRKEHAIIHII